MNAARARRAGDTLGRLWRPECVRWAGVLENLGAFRLANQHVVLTVPAQPEFLRVVRMTASGLGSRLGFTIDEVDDLRLALDELCFVLIGKGCDAELTLTYELRERALAIRGQVAKETSPATALNDLSRQILTALVDEHELSDTGTTRCFSLIKRQSPATVQSNR